jgi:hypothetical protein
VLATDPKKLWWMGIDMHPLWRRRVAVVATYAAFIEAVWIHPRFLDFVPWLMIQVVAFVWGLDWLNNKTLWSRVFWLFLAVQAAAYLMHSSSSATSADDSLGIVLYWAAWFVVVGSVFKGDTLVQNGGGGWIAQAIKKTGQLTWTQQRSLARTGFAVGLDGFAWYEFGMRYKRLTAEQRPEIEELVRANPRGRWMYGRERVLLDDERMRLEDHRLRAQVQRALTSVLIVVALGLTDHRLRQWMLRPEVVTAGVDVGNAGIDAASGDRVVD